MPTRFSFNAANQFISPEQRERLYQYMERANPTVTLFMEGLNEAIIGFNRQRVANPHSNPVVIYRDFATLGHDRVHLNMSPQEVLQTARRIFGSVRNIVLYLGNEPHATTEKEVRAMSRWFADCIRLLVADNFLLCVGNFSAGTIDHPEWMHDFLQAVHENRSRVFLSEHSYTAVNPNTGWINRRVPENNTFVHLPIEQSLDYLHPKYWLTRKQVQAIFDAPFSQIPTWHYGRIKQFYQYAEARGWSMPKYIATEGLLDSMGDLKKTTINGVEVDRKFFWSGATLNVYDHMQRKFGLNSEFTEYKGDISYLRMWSQVYGVSEEAALFLVMSHAELTFPEECLGITVFTYSNAADWTRMGHNYTPYSMFMDWMADLARTRPVGWVGGRDSSKQPDIWLRYDDVYVEKGDEMATPQINWDTLVNQYIVTQTNSPTGLNVRLLPGLRQTVVGVLKVGDILKYNPDFPAVVADGYAWEPVILANGVRGWVAGQLLTSEPYFPDVPPTSTGYVTPEMLAALEKKWEARFVEFADSVPAGIFISEAQLTRLVAALGAVSGAIDNVFQIFKQYESE